MGRTKLLMTTAVMMTAIMMSGCGEEAYTLTDSEKELIVDYSAHVVTKYNTYQKEGLAYVWPEEEEAEAETSQTQTAETVIPETGTAAEVPDDTAENVDTVYSANAATLDELFGVPGIEINYIGARLADSYIEAENYALYPDSGKQYLVLGFDVTNQGDAVAYVDYLDNAGKFQVTLNGEVTTSSELTLLLQDFSTFEGTLKPGQTKETVLLFQVPATVTSMEKIDLVAKLDNSYQIILENE